MWMAAILFNGCSGDSGMRSLKASRGPVRFEAVVYDHAAALIGRRPWCVSRDPRLLFDAHAAAYERYRHQPLVPGIDIYNVEAEAYGASIEEPEGNQVPAITEHPCAQIGEMESILGVDLTRTGRFTMVLDVARRLQNHCRGADVRVPIAGPFSIAVNLAGFPAVLEAAVENPGRLRRLLDRIAANQIRLITMCAAQGLNVVVFESAAAPPLLSPTLFRQLVFPALTQMVEHIVSVTGRPAACILGGNTLPILEMLLEMKIGSILCPVETDQKRFLNRISPDSGLTVRVNMRPSVFEGGDETAAWIEADRVYALAADHPPAMIGSGVLSYAADPARVLRVKDYIEYKDKGVVGQADLLSCAARDGQRLSPVTI